VAPSTVPPATAPEALPFVSIAAENDILSVSVTQIAVGVLSNDVFGDGGRIVSVTQPDVGSAEIVGDQLIVDIPPSYSGEVSLAYTITDESGVESTATVRLVSVNVLGAIDELVDTRTAVSSASEAFERVGSVFAGLVRIRLSEVQLSVLAFAPVFLGAAAKAGRRREQLMAVTDVSWPQHVVVEVDGSDVLVRHDVLLWASWKTGKDPSGAKQRFVTLASGDRGWIKSSLLADTGY